MAFRVCNVAICARPGRRSTDCFEMLNDLCPAGRECFDNVAGNPFDRCDAVMDGTVRHAEAGREFVAQHGLVDVFRSLSVGVEVAGIDG